MKQPPYPLQTMVVAWMLLVAPLVVSLILLVQRGGSSATYTAVGLSGAAVAGAALMRRVVVRDLQYMAGRIEQYGDHGALDGAPVSTTAVREVAMAAARVLRALRGRVELAEVAMSTDDAIIDALHDPFLLCDGERTVVRANLASRHLFGDRVMERDLAASIRAPDVLEAADAVLGGASSRSVELVMSVPVERTFEVRIKPFLRPRPDRPDQPGERMIIITLHDISAIRRSEQMRADFIANASHELRTPLSSLIGFIETLRGPAHDDAEARERFLAIMHDQAGRMSRLVSDLMSLSRIELDEHMPPATPLAIMPLVESVLDSLELKAEGRGMRLAVNAPEKVPEIFGDSDQITQVLQNLVSNAIKYGHENTMIDVVLSVVDGATVGATVGGATRGRRDLATLLAVAVTDHSDGIPRTHLPRLTERFYRVDAARSRAMGGTGLGLAIVKHIVNRHRGRMTIESTVGVGSTFTVYFPAVGAGASTLSVPGVYSPVAENRPKVAADDD